MVDKEWTFYTETDPPYVAYRIRKMWWQHPIGGTAPHWVYSVTKMYGWPDANHFGTFKRAMEFVNHKLQELKHG